MPVHLCLVACLVLSVKWTADTVHFLLRWTYLRQLYASSFPYLHCYIQVSTLPGAGFLNKSIPVPSTETCFPETCINVEKHVEFNKEFQVVDIHTSERKMSCPIYCQILNDYSPIMYNCVCSDETLGLSHQQPFKRLFVPPDVQCYRHQTDTQTYLHKCLEKFKFKEVTHLWKSIWKGVLTILLQWPVFSKGKRTPVSSDWTGSSYSEISSSSVTMLILDKYPSAAPWTQFTLSKRSFSSFITILNACKCALKKQCERVIHIW